MSSAEFHYSQRVLISDSLLDDAHSQAIGLCLAFELMAWVRKPAACQVRAQSHQLRALYHTQRAAADGQIQLRRHSWQLGTVRGKVSLHS